MRSTEATAIRMISSLISLLRLIHEIFSLCVGHREETTMEQRKELFWVIDPSVLSAEEEGSGDEGLKSERESGVPTSICRI